jgi:phosphate transport system substrate-binding protein
LRSSHRRLALPLSLGFTAALLAGACSSTSNDPSGGSGGADGTVPAGAEANYESLSGTLNGSGATFPKAFYEEAIAEFSGGVAPDVVVNYGGGGSGKGKTDLADQVVQWAGTDSLVKDEDKASFKGGEFLYFPTVAAPITVSYNLEDVSDLKLSPDTLAGIFQAEITTWDAAEIKADNPDATLPSTPITVVHRSDGSGTTSNFTKYLAAAAPDTWTLESGDTVNWPTSTQAGNGNNGVAQIVTQTDGAVGYVDLSDAKASGLSFASIENKDGQFVAPTLEGASAALAGAEIKDDLTYSALNAAGAESYPITAGTYVLVYQEQPNQEIGDALKGWISYLLTDAQDIAADVDFAKLPDGLRDRAIAQLAELKIG